LLVGRVVLPLLDVADALVDALCGYVGQDAAPRHAKTHLRRIAASRRSVRAAPVVSWDEYARACARLDAGLA
jgi:hypothetical protein